MAKVFRGDRLKYERDRRGLTQTELGDRVGAGQNQIYRYEKGDVEPSAEVLANLAKELNVTADYLLGLTEAPSERLSEGQLSEREQLLITAFRRRDYMQLVKVAAQESD